MFLETGFNFKILSVSHTVYSPCCRCFADTIVGLQRFLNELQRFCNSVGIYINFDKTKIVVH